MVHGYAADISFSSRVRACRVREICAIGDLFSLCETNSPADRNLKAIGGPIRPHDEELAIKSPPRLNPTPHCNTLRPEP
jgi:hypothetical protein